MEVSRQECYSGLPIPSPGSLPDPGIESGFLTLQADSLQFELPEKPREVLTSSKYGTFVSSMKLWENFHSRLVNILHDSPYFKICKWFLLLNYIQFIPNLLKSLWQVLKSGVWSSE